MPAPYCSFYRRTISYQPEWFFYGLNRQKLRMKDVIIISDLTIGITIPTAILEGFGFNLLN